MERGDTVEGATKYEQEDIYAGRMLSIMAQCISSELAKYSGWMIAGFGAFLGLIVANIDKVAPYIAPQAIGCSVSVFMVAVVLNVFQRYMAAIVASSGAVAKEVEAISIVPPFNMPYTLSQIELSTFWPARKFVGWSNAKILAGDIALAGRIQSTMAQIQGALVLLQMVATVSAAIVIVNALQA